MGIPSYFTTILKKYPSIIKKNIPNSNELYFDANSLIYVSYYQIENELKKNGKTGETHFKYKDEIEKKIIQRTIQNIETIIHYILPTEKVYIVFDGVVPLAKMKQQRERRFKSFFIETLNNEKNGNSSTTLWDKTNITPGTDFMDCLNNSIQEYINETNFNISKNVNIYLSDVYEYGEGEHKLFKIIENTTYDKETNICIYGLDADLIVLGLFHLKQNCNIYLFREFETYMQHFIQEYILYENPYIFLYLNMFEKCLYDELSISMKQKNVSKYCIIDYIFLTFLCGNDFLPHIPCINLRNNGMSFLLDCYSMYLKQKNNSLVQYTYNIQYKRKIYTIQWNNMRKYLTIVAKYEKQLLIQEIKSLNTIHTNKTIHYDDISKKPIVAELRNIENYINPNIKHWEHRYYETLFSIHYNNKSIQDICIHYCSGLEWNLNYYMNNSKIDYIQKHNNVWNYIYNYAPLLKSLIQYIPSFNESLVQKNILHIHPKTQLFFVIPYQSIHLFHPILQNLYIKFFDLKQKKQKNIQYLDFCYAFCKYIWEGHLTLDYEILNINDLKHINSIIVENGF